MLTLTVINASAQRNFKPGYVVSLIGDTTKGWIDYKEWRENPRFITFKSNEQSPEQNHSTQTIQVFGILDADEFKRYVGPVTKGEVELAELSTGIDSSFVTDSIFLKTLVSGDNVTLYSYTDKIKMRFFIAEKNSAPIELKRYIYLDNKQTGKLREYNVYTQQLLNLAGKYQPNNSALITNMYKTPYLSKDLQGVVLQINNRTNKTYGLNRGAKRLYLGLAGSATQATFEGTGGIYQSRNTFKSVGPTVTLGADFLFDKNVGTWLFKIEMALSAAKVNASHSLYDRQGLNNIRSDYNITLDQFSVAVNPQLVYNIYNQQNFKFYLAAGVQLGVSTYSNKHYRTTTYLNNNFSGDSENRLVLKTLIPNYTAKTGVVVSDRFDINLGYMPRQNITPYSESGTTNLGFSTYRIGVNYLFGKK